MAGIQITRAALDAVLSQVSLEMGVPPADILGHRRTARIAHARQYAMWRLRQMKRDGRHKHSLEEIGRVFSRDHATVIFALRQVDKRMVKLTQEVAA